MTPLSSPTHRSRSLVTLWLLALLLPALAGLWAYVTTRSAVVEGIARSRCALAHSMAARLEQNLDFDAKLVAAAGTGPGLAAAVSAGETERMRQSLENVQTTLPGLRGVAVVERDGGRIFARHPADFAPPPAEGAERVPGVAADGQPVLVVRAPVRDSPGAVLLAEVTLADLARPVLETTLGENVSGFVVDRNGRAVVGRTSGDRQAPGPEALRPLVEPWQLHTLFVPGSGGRELAALAPLPHYPWAFLITQPEEEALAPIAAFRQRLGLGLLSLIATGLGLGAVLARRLRRDAERLRGEQALQAEEELRKTRDGLEQGVRERTTALESANAIMKAVFEGTADAIYVKDLAGRYLLANAAAARDVGRRPEEMLGRDDTDLFTPGDAKLIQELDRAIMAAGESRIIEQELQIGKETRFFLSTKGPYRDSAGRVIGLIGIARDITDRKRSEEALRQSQKLESLGLLAGGVAHDFNNLLVAMLGQTTLAHSKLAPGDPARDNLDKAVKAAERAADLTRQMLAYSGRGHFQVRPVQLNAVIEENLHLLRVAVSKQVRLVSDLAPDLPWIDADVGQIQQVVMNLITNAAEAIGEREGSVVVVTGVRTVGAGDASLWRHTGDPLSPGRYVSLEARDDGGGMDAATVDRIFDPFFTTKFTGRGLGLAAVLGIVRGHKGGMSVESALGRGTVFRLLFPVSTKVTAPRPRDPDVKGARGSVLVIDDEEVVREAIADGLGSRSLTYLLARDGDEGLALARSRGAEIGLVILDLSMPGRSGEETFRELRKLLPEVPVILSSGYGEEQAKARFAGQDLAGFLQKPYRLNTLIGEVERCLKVDAP